ncbi:Hypothetical predicted protein [Marmota monax]|uniref:HECT-type E3 ubiquitin transferase n=1 Tax=Marmota monax TaxID=9995 RepID=A0A5E4CV58_MARMO|nr:Hypothetical predicted protein [Marmota monax]
MSLLRASFVDEIQCPHIAQFNAIQPCVTRNMSKWPLGVCWFLWGEGGRFLRRSIESQSRAGSNKGGPVHRPQGLGSRRTGSSAQPSWVTVGTHLLTHTHVKMNTLSREQVAAVREGMSWIVPVPLLSLLTAKQLEQMVCGMPEISVEVLKKVVRYREVDEQHQLVQWFWHTLEEFSNEERVLFMRFVSGRSRLPANTADISQRFQIMKVDRPYDSLPTSQTCFFQLRLPPYSSQLVMAERLRYAINNCRSIDMDNYMLSRNVDNTEGSDTDY